MLRSRAFASSPPSKTTTTTITIYHHYDGDYHNIKTNSTAFPHHQHHNHYYYPIRQQFTAEKSTTFIPPNHSNISSGTITTDTPITSVDSNFVTTNSTIPICDHHQHTIHERRRQDAYNQTMTQLCQNRLATICPRPAQSMAHGGPERSRGRTPPWSWV